MFHRPSVFLVIPLTVLSFCVHTLGKTAGPLPVRESFAFTHVTIIDTTGGPAKPDMTVIVSGRHIVEVRRTSEVRVPKGVRIVDATGKFLIPGLWDMNWHSLPDAQMRSFYFPLAIANGVTGVRDMFGDCMKGCERLSGHS
jgi:imidazolonepropionase-like amidohydrolase